MKQFAFSSLSILLGMGAISPVALASQPANSDAAAEQLSVTAINPFELTYLAYNGALEEYGIPAAQYLIQDYQWGRITAEDIVQAAVDNNVISEAALSDYLYISQVEDFMESLGNRS